MTLDMLRYRLCLCTFPGLQRSITFGLSILHLRSAVGSAHPPIALAALIEALNPCTSPCPSESSSCIIRRKIEMLHLYSRGGRERLPNIASLRQDFLFEV